MAKRRRRSPYSGLTTAATSLGTGALLMYLFDPDRGNRRRSVVRDQIEGSVHDLRQAVTKTYRDTSNRITGVVRTTSSRFSSDHPSDQQLEGRVRATLGRVVSHPRAVETLAHEGALTLRGYVLEDELKHLISTISRVKGVQSVHNELHTAKHENDIPALQGGKTQKVGTSALPEYWSPSARVLGLITGSALSVVGLTRRGLLGGVSAIIGGTVLLRSTTNKPLSKVFGVGAGRRAVDIHKTVSINAPIDKVFDFFADYGNFPLFMSNVRAVSFTEPDRTHWVVKGPAGIDVEWDAELTKFIPNKMIGWKSVTGSMVENAGVLMFETSGERTRVDIRLAYNPPAGAIGHTVAMLFGADPHSQMDQDLMRVKTSLETGNIPRDAAVNQ